jgi:uncharacterized protein (DUF983 family)
MTAPAQPQTVVCPDCGTAMAAPVRFCTFCGLELKDADLRDAPLQPGLSVRAVLAVILVALVVAGVIYLALNAGFLGPGATPLPQPAP